MDSRFLNVFQTINYNSIYSFKNNLVSNLRDDGNLNKLNISVFK